VSPTVTVLSPALPYNFVDNQRTTARSAKAMATAGIEVKGLRKHYGATAALEDVTFTVSPGEITGFVGPNGAGKSTTMRAVLGLDALDGGTALIAGRRYADHAEPLCEVGALLDAGALQHNRTGRNHLMWLAHSHGLSASRVDEVIDLVGLGPASRRKAGGYSLGMRQRLGIAAAMLGDPPNLLMDEPFNGMDPEGIVWMRGFLRSLAGQGRAVLISSHLMSELQDVADHVVVIGRGRVLADTSVRALLATYASLEEAYFALTSTAVEFQAGMTDGGSG
jgi:ABC-2 type transport system ATP-binding protein